MRSASPFFVVYRWPAAIAALTVAGLLFALFGDGAWDAISWFLLYSPLGVIVIKLLRTDETLSKERGN